jgi:glycosyltransferase involved in cell wall biosynthesis
LNKSVGDISVIIPAYNRAALIGATLWSLLNQTVPATEIIVVDDGSQDETAEKTLEAFENWKLETGNWKNDDGEQVSGNSTSNIQHPTLKILRRANAGPGAARNRGLAEATGEFIHFFDSDDIAAPNKHEVQLRALHETGADIAYGPWVKGRLVNLTTEDTENTEEEAVLRLGKPSGAAFSNPFTSELARDFANTSPNRLANIPASSPETCHSSLVTTGFSAEGPVLQAQGLPQGDLIKALLTNWSVVPHACLFRRSILEKAGGFPEDIWVGEDQLLFLRCLLAGAKVVHTPGTMVFYRLGEEGKLTESKEGQRRRVVDWGRFLVKASEDVSSGELRVARKRICLTTEDTECTEEAQGNAQGTCACAAESDPLACELAVSPVSESLTRSAIGPASSPATRNPLLVTTTPSAWFGFRLRAYEAWRDLRAFFPGEYLDLEKELKKIWKRSRISGFGFQVSGFVLRKWGGLMNRIFGHRVKGCFRPGKFTSRVATLFDAQ